ncbi:ABC transporter substrate-binding protein [Diaminobutyricibacter tongyongensis]|uniref:ABC transporter substrate-binding protein n=1 Tax=Leifsonia tongyongensis TaxID=1268043 RepID=A0A6L9XU11_9MICO|nr:ABC transporter substrate-binding protein [Diaminobutyricibacter tongyongensis]NEN04564.1 ABC transporter substrate-binding protein [Diaminobutyricibacter tongyongensis]
MTRTNRRNPLTNARRKGRVAAAVALAVASAALLAACSSAQASTPTTAPAATLRLGFFDNITHGPALVGLQSGTLQSALGKTKLSAQIFNAGPAEIEALTAGAIDAAYIGPSPAINSYIKSHGESLKIVAGATNGGASLVVAPGITSAADLKGKTLASPQLGNTQDVALRFWLKSKGYQTQVSGSGDVTINPTENAQTLALFKTGKLDGAWLPEPWASRLVVDAGAKVLVDEASLWPKKTFPTTVLVVSKQFLVAHPQTVAALVKGNADAITWLNTHKPEAAELLNEKLKADTGKTLSTAVIDRALSKVTFSNDPVASAYPTLVSHAVAVGTGKAGSIKGLLDLSALNTLRAKSGLSAISTGGE